MRFSWCAALFALVLLAISALFYLHPEIDLLVASQFYNGRNFIWQEATLPVFFHNLVRPSGWVFGLGIAICLVITLLRGSFLRLDRRAWFFLAVSLAAGPGLLTNLVLKDHWDRARPRQVEQFGGTAQFSPPLKIVMECERNCAFVSGDAAMAFWLHSFAYVVPRRRRLVMAAGLSIGAGVGLLRIGMGAHFLSDVYFAGLFIAMTSGFIFALIYGRAALAVRWREWLGGCLPSLRLRKATS